MGKPSCEFQLLQSRCQLKPNCTGFHPLTPHPATSHTRTLQVVHDTTHYPHAHIPPDLAYRLTFIPTPPYPYLPILAANHMSLKRSDWTPLNLTHPTPTELHLSVSLTSLGMYRLSYTLDTAFARMRDPDFPLHVAEEEIENLRQMVFEVNPTLLAVTVFASMLHMLFEFLALKEDVVHWKRVKYGDEGVSRTTLVLNAVNKVVVVGYLYDKRSVGRFERGG
ncbi:cleft lip and palate transmembrane protein 1-domain-containing protein [Jimgerdemannia flammicorona]|uniref:Cleft lip and palate transmembrane protein 1-domain-containing protein n=1 Tax=Jimgerdemannia flammicorona TaxID=994334 RepID=A0A433QVD2_9FUNG|nr:cleft lip and palate transmembrane protein 1-domain-containing protein [Jimgerdemannia flammicorona]